MYPILSSLIPSGHRMETATPRDLLRTGLAPFIRHRVPRDWHRVETNLIESFDYSRLVILVFFVDHILSGVHSARIRQLRLLALPARHLPGRFQHPIRPKFTILNLYTRSEIKQWQLLKLLTILIDLILFNLWIAQWSRLIQTLQHLLVLASPFQLICCEFMEFYHLGLVL